VSRGRQRPRWLVLAPSDQRITASAAVADEDRCFASTRAAWIPAIGSPRPRRCVCLQTGGLPLLFP